jgi:endoglucanase
MRRKYSGNRIAIAICMALVFLVGAKLGFAHPQPDISVARTRAKHLRRGTNLSEWFAQVYDAKGCTKEHFESWNTLADLALIKAMGFDHVRLSLNPKAMWQHNDADEIPAEYLTYLNTAVKMILEEDLAVVIDIHPDGDFKEKLTNDALPKWRRACGWRDAAA